MKITNKYSLPDEFVRAIENDSYTRGESDYSVSDLVSPPRVVLLSRRHDSEIKQDAVDRLWALFGQVAHGILERSGVAGDGAIHEKRYFLDVLGKRVSGQIDLLKDGVLSDYKTTSVWTIVYGSRSDEWETRMNLYKLLAEKNGDKVTELRIIAILRDWTESRVGGNYPDSPVVSITLGIWGQFEAEAYLEGRVLALKEAERLSDNELPECTSEETWERYDRKTGKTRRMRCERYCPAVAFCNQYREWREENE